MNRRSLLVIITIALLFGCTGKTTPINSEIDNDISGAAQPGFNRIISAAPAYTEIIVGLDLADKLIAVDKYSRDLEGLKKDLPEVDFFYPDIEAIADLKPDIIIMGEINTNGNADTAYQFFRRLGIEVMQVPTSNSIAEIYSDITTIAKTLGVPERGEELVRRMKEHIETIAAKARENNKNVSGEKSASGKTVYFEITPAPNMVSFGRGTYLNELIEITGTRNIFADEKRWFTPGAETIINANPDLIIILSGISDAEEIKNRPGFRQLNAVRYNRIFSIDADHASRPSQNIVLALEEMYNAVWQEQ